MGLTQAVRLLTPEEIAVRAGEQVPYLRMPERASVFADREMRLRQRAASHPMRDFLLFMAGLARGQHELLQSYPAVALPNRTSLVTAANAGAPPLAAASWSRDPVWREQLRKLVDRLLPDLAGSPALDAVQTLRDFDDPSLERQADLLLNGVMFGLDLAVAPLIAAGLQAYWAHLVLATQAAHGADQVAPFGRTSDATTCPACGCRPTASITRIGADDSGYRYLHCSLCSVQWHMVRIKCAHCEGTKGIQYQSLQPIGVSANSDGTRQAVQAETCDTCGHYLKIVHMERDAHVEPAADDLASITLDLLVSEAGFHRHGVNLMLLFGDPGDPDPGKPDPGDT
jgi:FdhE protein